MRRVLIAVFLLLMGISALAQTTAVTATLQDSDGQLWANGTCSVKLLWSTTKYPTTTPYRKDIGPGTLVPQNPPCTVDVNGNMSVTVTDVAYIFPPKSTWEFSVCPAVYQGNTGCGVTQVPVTGASENLTGILSVPAPRVGGGIGAYAYADVEVAPLYNNFYWNTTTNSCRSYQTAWGACTGGGGGGGGVIYVTSAPTGACLATPPIQVNSLTGIAYACNNGNWAPIGAGGVTSINALQGAVNLIAGSNITITPSGQNIQITSTAGGGGAVLPYPGIVYGTNSTSGSIATSAQVVAAINNSPTTTISPSALPALAAFPSGNGVVFNTSVTASRNATGSDINTLIAALTGCGTAGNVYSPQAVGCIAQSGGGATFPGTNGLVKNTSTTASVTAVANTDYMPAIAEASFGYGLVSTGSGNAWSPQIVPLSYASSGNQYIQQTLGTGNYTSFNINSFNKVFYVDGFNYSGIGASVIAYSSSTDAAQCQVVSYSGSYYIAVSTPNHTTTPGSNFSIWYPVPNNAASTASDCAWYTAEAYMRLNHQAAKVVWGSGHYSTNQSFVNAVDGNSYDDEFAVSGEGCGSGCTYILYTGPTAIPVFYRPTGGGNFASMRLDNMEIDGNGVASATIDLSRIGQAYIENITTGHVAPGSDHVVEFGATGGDAFQVYPSHLNVGIYPDSSVGNCGTFTATPSGSTVTIGITSGGSCYSSSYTGLTKVLLLGTRGNTAPTPCSTMPTGGGAVTINGSGAVTAVTPLTGAAGCSGTIYVQIYQTTNVNYGVKFYNSDSTSKDVTVYVGSVAGIYTADGESTHIHLHPTVIPNGIVTIGGDTFVGTECDNIGRYCIEQDEPFTLQASSFVATGGLVGSYNLTGGATFYFGSAISGTNPVNISATKSLCTGGGVPTGWQEFLTQSGPIVNPPDYFTKAAVGLSVISNDVSCGQAMGDYGLTGAINVLSGGFINMAGNHTMQIDDDTNYPRLIFNDATSNVWALQVYGASSSSNAVGTSIPRNACYQWNTNNNGQANADSYLCAASTNHYTLGSTPGGTDGTLTLGNITVGSCTGCGGGSGTVPTAYSNTVTYAAGAIAYDGSGNNYSSLSSGNVGNALTNTTYWHFLGGISSTITGGTCTTTGQYMTGISTTGVPICSALSNVQAACLAATTITVPCSAYQSGAITGLSATYAGSVQTLYSSNAPAGAVLQICPSLFQDSGTGSGQAELVATWTTPGGTTVTSAPLQVINFVSGGAVGYGACSTISTGANTTASINVLAAGGSGTVSWEYNLVVTRLQ